MEEMKNLGKCIGIAFGIIFVLFAIFNVIIDKRNTYKSFQKSYNEYIYGKGIILTGGGALIKGIGNYIHNKIKIPVFIASNPLTCIAEGCGILLNNPKDLNKNC